MTDFNLSENAKKIFNDLYSFQNETIEQTFRRVASEFGDVELSYEYLSNNIWRPNTPTFLNAGTGHKVFSACYVVGLDDSMESIYDMANVARKIFQFGSGIGIPIGNLREKEAFIFEGNEETAPEGKSCLTGDTVVLNDKTNISVENQHVTIEWLYEYYQNVKNPKYRVRAMLDDFGIGINTIEDVVYNGRRPVYEISTKDGYKIKATSNHRFLSESGEWKKVEDFSINDKIGVNGKTRPTAICKRCGKIKLLRGSRSKYNGLCENCVVSVFHGCSLKGSDEEFEKRSKARERHKNIYLWNRENHICERCGETEKRIEVHHKDGNPYNNEITNLEVLCIQCHNDEHKKRRAKGNYRLTKEIYFDKITNIEYIGIDKVYDIKMKEPYHNFIANGFVSHNSGPITFMKLYDAVGETTKSGGRVRRAAILCSLPVWHPDIIDFIKCKEIDGRLSNMNISVALTDNFMQCLDDNVPFELHTPYDGRIIDTIDPHDVWDKLCEMSHKTADPGILFIDNINRMNPLKKLYKIECCNPCGEQPLIPFGCCNLSHINVYKFVKDGTFDWDGLYKAAYDVTMLMDNVIDVMDFPDERFKEMSQKYRQIGIGFMGLSDTLFELGYRYNGPEGREFTENIMKTLTTASIDCSADLAKENGPISDWELVKDDALEIYATLTDNNEKILNKVKEFGVRNIAHTTVAPTGTTALSCDASYGMEPCFGLVFEKHVIDGTTMHFVNPIFERKYRNEPWFTDDLIEKIAKNGGSLKNLRGIPKEVREVFVTAHDIKYKERIDMQSSIQKHCSTAISSTINLPEDTTIQEISDIYKYSYKKGLKGVTIYRDGCKQNQPVTFTKKEERVRVDASEIQGLEMKRYFVQTGNGKVRVKVGTIEGKPVEVELTVGKAGQTMNASTEALGRVISIGLQNGVPIQQFIDTLIGINSDKPCWFRFDVSDKKPSTILSVPDGVAQLLRKYYSDVAPINISGETCPFCGSSNVIMIEGCMTCNDCSSSKCS